MKGLNFSKSDAAISCHAIKIFRLKTCKNILKNQYRRTVKSTHDIYNNLLIILYWLYLLLALFHLLSEKISGNATKTWFFMLPWSISNFSEMAPKNHFFCESAVSKLDTQPWAPYRSCAVGNPSVMYVRIQVPIDLQYPELPE